MRFTLNIDGDLLDRVKSHLGTKTKTEAIHQALEEIDRRHRLHEILKKGSGVPAEELPYIFDPASDPMKLRVAEMPSEYGFEQE